MINEELETIKNSIIHLNNKVDDITKYLKMIVAFNNTYKELPVQLGQYAIINDFKIHSDRYLTSKIYDLKSFKLASNKTHFGFNCANNPKNPIIKSLIEGIPMETITKKSTITNRIVCNAKLQKTIDKYGVSSSVLLEIIAYLKEKEILEDVINKLKELKVQFVSKTWYEPFLEIAETYKTFKGVKVNITNKSIFCDCNSINDNNEKNNTFYITVVDHNRDSLLNEYYKEYPLQNIALFKHCLKISQTTTNMGEEVGLILSLTIAIKYGYDKIFTDSNSFLTTKTESHINILKELMKEYTGEIYIIPSEYNFADFNKLK